MTEDNPSSVYDTLKPDLMDSLSISEKDSTAHMNTSNPHKTEFLSDPDEEDESSDDSQSEDEEEEEEEVSWVVWFCSLRGSEFFCQVDEDYIQDDFNLTGLSSIVPYYDYALDTILDIETNSDDLTEMQQEMIDSAAEMLYGLIHARFILTNRGMSLMLEKYKNVEFGRCHRVYCQGQPVLPVGQSDLPRQATVHVFCPKCKDIFYPKASRQAHVDGANFGTTFAHLFLMTHADLVPLSTPQQYTPRVFGYKIHSSSPFYTGKQRKSKPRRVMKAFSSSVGSTPNAHLHS